MTRKPFAQSFWVRDKLLCAGQYPGAVDPATRDEKLRGLLDCGIRRVLSLMEPNELGLGGARFEPYASRLAELAAERGGSVDFINLPIRDASAPSTPRMQEILAAIDGALRDGLPLYFHCWGGHGRTSVVAACHLIQNGATSEEAIAAIMDWRAALPKSHFPFEGDQERFVRSWVKG